MTDIIKKYEALRVKAEKRLKELYPDSDVQVIYHGETRSKEEQNKHKKSGASTTNASLHMVGGARDFNIKIDGKVLGNSEKDFKIYKDVLWKAAEESGFHHLDEDGFGRTDPYHIGLVKEKGDGTAFERLFKEYPSLTKEKNVKDSIEDLRAYQEKNPNDTAYTNILSAYDKTISTEERKEQKKVVLSENKEKLLKLIAGKDPKVIQSALASYKSEVEKRTGKELPEAKEAKAEQPKAEFAQGRNINTDKPKDAQGGGSMFKPKPIKTTSSNPPIKKEVPKKEVPKEVIPKTMAETKEPSKETIKETTAAPSGYNYGLKNHKGENIMLKGRFASEKEKQMLDTELARIEVVHGVNSDEARKFKETRFEKVDIPEIRDGYRKKIEDAQNRFDNGTTPEEVKTAKKELDTYTKVYERTNTKDPWRKQYVQNIWTDDDARGADLPMSYNEWTDSFIGAAETQPDIVEEEPSVTPPYEGDDATTGTGKATPPPPQEDITLLPPKPGTTTTGTGSNTINYKADLEKAQADLDALNAPTRERAPFEYAPDNQSDQDVLGSLIDVGRGVAGMIDANKEVPKYERGSMWQTAMGEAEARRNEGLTAQERDYRNQQSETAYAYNVKNIRRGVGGSAGAYLGNIQSAAGDLYSQYGQTAAIDEGLRRQSRANFQQMAGADEGINRQIFQDDLAQVMATKEAGAGLVQDAIANISDRRDYQKQYGKDSPWYRYQRDISEEAYNAREDRLDANQERIGQNKRQAQYNLNKAQDAYDKSQSLTPGEKPTAPTEDATVKPTGTNMVEQTISESTAEQPTVEQPKIGEKSYDEQEVSTGTKLNKETGELEKASKFTPKEVKQDIETKTPEQKERATVNAKVKEEKDKDKELENEYLADIEKYELGTPKHEAAQRKLDKLRKKKY